MKGLFKILLLIILFSSCDKINNEKESCTTNDCKEWSQGRFINSTGQIDLLESPKISIKSETDDTKRLTLKSRINKFHTVIHLDFDIYFKKSKNLPKDIKIRLTNNKGKSITLKGKEKSNKNLMGSIRYYSFINLFNDKKIQFVTNGMIRKVEFINTKKNQVFYDIIPSFSESIDIKNLFCCSVVLKETVVGQE